MATLVLNRRRTSLSGMVALAVAALAGLAVYSYLSYLRAQVPVSGKMAPMVVAANDIQPGTTLQAGMLEVTQHPSRYLPAGAVGGKEMAAGRTVTVPIFKGEPVVRAKMGRVGGLSSVVPPGQRAYSLSVGSGAGLGFLPRPGDRVDVIVTLPAEALGRATTQTVLRSKEVASTGAGAPAEARGQTGKFGLTDSRDRTLGITLFVDPAEAERLALAEALGRITVVLAPSAPDTGKVPGPVTAADIGLSSPP